GREGGVGGGGGGGGGGLKGGSVSSFPAETAGQLADKRVSPGGAALKAQIESILKLPKREGVPEFRILRPAGGRGYPKPHATTYAVETEPGVLALVHRLSDGAHYSRPPLAGKAGTLYVSHHRADTGIRGEAPLAQLV